MNATAFDSVTGKGVKGEVDGQRVALGNRALLDNLKIDLGELAAQAENAAKVKERWVRVRPVMSETRRS